MKKALVVLLAVAMIFCFAATAMAATYTDMADQTEAAQDAVAFNSALGIIAGYSDGTYGPEKNITRAEFAKIAVNAAGLADSADYLANTASKFSDVKVGAWYTGYINLAQSQGYLAGYPDGTFRPNATITNQEVVTVLLRMLGYSDNLTGPWPVDYINQAVKLDLLDDVNFVGAVPANRADVAVMTKATLDQDLVDWDKDKDAFVGKTVATTLLKDSFGASTVASDKLVDGIVTGTAAVVGPPAVVYVPVKLDQVKAFTFDKDDAKLTLNTGSKQYTMTADTAISDGMTFDQLAGNIVNLVLKDAGKKTETVAYIDVTSYVKSYDKITAAAPTVAGKVQLDDKNFDTVTAGFVATNFAAKTDTNNSHFYAYFNDDDEVYAVIADKQVTGANKTGVVEEVSAKGKFTCHAGNVDQISDEANVMLIKDGVAAKLTDIKEFDVVKQFNTANDKIYLVSAMASGKLDKVYSTALTIAGTKYVNTGATVFDVDGDAAVLNDYIGKDVKYVLDATNDVIAVYCGEAVASTTIKGIVTDFKKTDGTYSAGALDTITVFTNEGKTVTYKVDSKYQLNAPGVAAFNTGLATNGYVDFWDGTTTDVTPAAGGDGKPEISIGSYVEFKIDTDSVIKTAINYTTGTTAVVNGIAAAPVDDDNNYITLTGKKYSINDKTIVFNITKNTDNEIEVELLKLSDVMSGNTFDTSSLTFNLADANNKMVTDNLFGVVDGLDAKVLVASDANGTSGAKYGMVEDRGWLDADGYAQVKLYGDAKEYTVWGANATLSKANAAFLAEDAFYEYTVSGDTITFKNATDSSIVDNINDAYPIVVAGPGVKVQNVSSNLVSFDDGTQGEITEDTVILNVVFNSTVNTTIDEINVWDAADLDVNQKVYHQITSGDVDYIIVVE